MMCSGAFGKTFFVEDRNSGLEYTLKKVAKITSVVGCLIVVILEP